MKTARSRNRCVRTRAPYPEYAGIQYLRAEGIGNYNGLGMKLSQRFGSNLTTLFSYTWSKALDDGSCASAVAGTISRRRICAAARANTASPASTFRIAS